MKDLGLMISFYTLRNLKKRKIRKMILKVSRRRTIIKIKMKTHEIENKNSTKLIKSWCFKVVNNIAKVKLAIKGMRKVVSLRFRRHWKDRMWVVLLTISCLLIWQLRWNGHIFWKTQIINVLSKRNKLSE